MRFCKDLQKRRFWEQFWRLYALEIAYLEAPINERFLGRFSFLQASAKTKIAQKSSNFDAFGQAWKRAQNHAQKTAWKSCKLERTDNACCGTVGKAAAGATFDLQGSWSTNSLKHLFKKALLSKLFYLKLEGNALGYGRLSVSRLYFAIKILIFSLVFLTCSELFAATHFDQLDFAAFELRLVSWRTVHKRVFLIKYFI